MFPCTGTANYVRIDLWGCPRFRTFDILISETALPPTAVTSLPTIRPWPIRQRNGLAPAEQYYTLVTLESRSEVKATPLGCSVYWTDIVKTMTGPVPYLNDLCFGITSCKINNIGEIALSCDAFMLRRRLMPSTQHECIARHAPCIARHAPCRRQDIETLWTLRDFREANHCDTKVTGGFPLKRGPIMWIFDYLLLLIT